MNRVFKVTAPPLRSILIGLLIGLMSLTLPLLRDFHWESAGVASLALAFYAALRMGRGSRSGSVFRDGLAILIGWSAPLILFTISTGCWSFDGLAFWVSGPPFSLLFGWSAGRAVRSFGGKWSGSIALLSIAGFAIVPLVVQFFSFPQLYFYNHIWSYWPGPIYDEVVQFDTRLILFRTITLLWVLLFWAVPAAGKERVYQVISLGSLFALLFSYAHLSNWGLISPEERIQQELGMVYESDHFRIFYPAERSSGRRVEASGQDSRHNDEPDGAGLERTSAAKSIADWAEIHETHLKEITEELGLDLQLYRETKVHSYIYNSSDQKKRLTGAGRTSFAPVWLSQDQIHIAEEVLERVLRHELVHVAAKQFGNRFGASTSIGLVEGLAVALDPGRYGSSVHRLVAARDPYPDSEELRRLLGAGFYSSAGSVSYLISGSFIRYLIDHYPVERLRKAYRTGDIEKAYAPYTLEELTRSWHRYLDSQEPDLVDVERADALFRTPSIFEKPCPRVAPGREN